MTRQPHQRPLRMDGHNPLPPCHLEVLDVDVDRVAV